MKSFLRLLARAVPFLAITVVRGATTLSVSPDQDALVSTGASNAFVANNYGAAGAVSVAGPGTAKGEQRSFLRFDVSSIKAGFDAQYGVGNWTITGVALTLLRQNPGANPVFNTSNVSGTFGIDWVPTDSWVEGTGTPNVPTTDGVAWNDVATLSSGAVSQGSQTYTAGTGQVTYTLTPTSGLLADITNGSSATLMLSTSSSSMSAVFASRNNGTSSNWPVLNVTATPEPARAALLLAGAFGFVIRRRRQGV